MARGIPLCLETDCKVFCFVISHRLQNQKQGFDAISQNLYGLEAHSPKTSLLEQANAESAHKPMLLSRPISHLQGDALLRGQLQPGDTTALANKSVRRARTHDIASWVFCLSEPFTFGGTYVCCILHIQDLFET